MAKEPSPAAPETIPFHVGLIEDDEDDQVVLEMDVYICNDLLGTATDLCLLQHPLRPSWRPYQYAKVKQVRMKPQSRRIEIDLPLDTETPNYNDVIEEYKKVKSVTLRSNLVEQRTTHAVATVRDGKFLLIPLDYAVQMRPTLNYLNVAAAAAGKKRGAGDEEDDDDDEDDEPKMHAVEVQVQKRETERQQQARLNSYAYINAKEEEEAFVNLTMHSCESRAAHSVWNSYVKSNDTAPYKNLDRQTYLKGVIPAGAAVGTAADGSAAPGPSGVNASTAADDSLQALSEAARAALPEALRQMTAQHSVLSMGNVRTWLSNEARAGAASEAARLVDKALHQMMVDSGLVTSMHRVYVVHKTGDEATDPLRKLVLELLAAKESFKKSELNDLARTNNVKFTDNTYHKVVKDICVSRGNSWHIKQAADDL